MRNVLLLSISAGALSTIGWATAQNWIQSSAPSIYWRSLASSANGSNIVAVSFSSSGIYISTDSGITWNSNSLHTTVGFNCVASSADGNRLLVGTTSHALFSSTNAGMTWRSNSIPVNSWMSVASSADGVKLAAGSFGPIYTSHDSGATWQVRDISVPPEYAHFVWKGLTCSADGTKLAAVGSGSTVYPLDHRAGLIYTSTNSGITWQPTQAPDTNWCSIACSADATTLIAASSVYPYGQFPYSSSIFVSTNFGSTWRICDNPETRGLQREISVACSADGTRMVAASAGFSSPGVILISTNSGLTWSSNNTPVGGWSAVASSADGGKLAAAIYSGPIYTRASSGQWLPSLSITPSGNEAVISWIIPSSDFVLQQSSDLGVNDWAGVQAIPTLTNMQKRVTIPLLPGAWYYRLKSL